MEKFPSNDPEIGLDGPDLHIKQRRGALKKKIKTWLVLGVVASGTAGILQEREASQADPDHYISYVEKSEQLSPEARLKLKEEITYLDSEVGVSAVDDMRAADNAAAERRKQVEKDGAAIKVEGFDKFGLDNAKLGELWSESNYPKGSLEGNVGIIRNESELERLMTPENRAGDVQELAFSNDPGIVFHNIPPNARSTEVLRTMDYTFSHELGHRNDWLDNINLSPSERVEFFSDVVHVFERPGSYRDVMGYVDSFSDADKSQKIKEWWAVLCQDYLSMPEEAGQIMSPEEHALLMKWMLRTDPHFDPVQAEARRHAIIQQIVEKR